MKNELNIVFVADDNYIKYTAVTITSILLNNENENFCFHIISNNISQKNKNEIYKLRKYNNFKIKYYEIENHKNKLFNFLMSYYKKLPNVKYITNTALAKFLIPRIFKNLDKILYLDGDIIVQKDLKSLYDYNLFNYYAGIVNHSLTNLSRINKAKSLNLKNYFNSGVILFNVKKWNEDNLDDKLIKLTPNIEKNRTYIDQDYFNVLFNEEVLALPYIYNTLFYPNMSDAVKDFKEKGLDASVIIHYISKYKPWKGYWDKRWNYYYKKSPFFNMFDFYLKKSKNLLLKNTSQKNIIKRILRKLHLLNLVKKILKR